MIHIVGAGMAGLLAGCMLGKDTRVFEQSDQIPNNHKAILRFRSSIVGDTLNIQFRKVRMMKAIHPWANPVADQMAYSRKANGSFRLRSAVSATGEIEDRYIAPADLISQMASRVHDIKLSHEYAVWSSATKTDSVKAVISTIPMPTLMSLLEYPLRERCSFGHSEGLVLTATIQDCDSYCTVYDPDPTSIVTRASITGNKMIVETVARSKLRSLSASDLSDQDIAKAVVARATFLLGIMGAKPIDCELSRQRYAKILPIDEEIRRRFIMWASEKHGIYSLGRFACWRPGLLLDDVVSDVRKIVRLINGETAYRDKIGE